MNGASSSRSRTATKTPIVPDEAADFFFDTVTLSNFTLVGRLDLLAERYGPRATVTPEVLAEVIEGIAAGFDGLRAIEAAVREGTLGCGGMLSAEERDAYRGLIRLLSPGEASCIACAKTRGGTVVTDDRAARGCCAERGIPLTGTIGILKACCRDGALVPDEADALLAAMVAAGYYSPVRRISDLL